jgi:hypothetical protein
MDNFLPWQMWMILFVVFLNISILYKMPNPLIAFQVKTEEAPLAATIGLCGAIRGTPLCGAIRGTQLREVRRG